MRNRDLRQGPAAHQEWRLPGADTLAGDKTQQAPLSLDDHTIVGQDLAGQFVKLTGRQRPGNPQGDQVLLFTQGRCDLKGLLQDVAVDLVYKGRQGQTIEIDLLDRFTF